MDGLKNCLPSRLCRWAGVDCAVPASIFWFTCIGRGHLAASLPSIRLAWTLPDQEWRDTPPPCRADPATGV